MDDLGQPSCICPWCGAINHLVIRVMRRLGPNLFQWQPKTRDGGGASSPDEGCLRALTGIMKCGGRQHNKVVYISKARCALLEAGLVLTQALHKDRFVASG